MEVWRYPTATPPRNELNIQNENNLIATLQWADGQDNPYTIQDEEAKANALLIAAAPDLLAALRLALLDNDMEGIELNTDTVTAARAAITKAEGGTGA